MPQKKYYKKNYSKNNQKALIKKEVKQQINSVVETKEHDEYNATTVSTTINVTDPLQTLARGTDGNDYIGDKISPSYFRVNWIASAGTTDTYNYIRFLIIQDKDVVGTPTLSSIFQNTSNPIISELNTNYRHEYNVLYDKVLNLANYTGYPHPYSGHIKIKGKRMRQIRFNSAGSCNAGQLWLVAVSDSNAVNHPILGLYTRLYFKDA